MSVLAKKFATAAVGVLLLAAPALAGPELVTNGDFATNDFTGWTVGQSANGSAWSAATGAAVFTSGGAGSLGTLDQNTIGGLIVGHSYVVQYVAASTGIPTNFFAFFNGQQIGATGAGVTGLQQTTIVYNGGGTNFNFAVFSNSGTWTIDNVSVRDTVPELNVAGSMMPLSLMLGLGLLAYDRRRKVSPAQLG